MRLLVFLTFLVIWAIVFGYSSARWAERLGRPFMVWAVAGVILGPFTWVLLGLLTVLDRGARAR